jgi:hypothetical protein
LLAAVSGDHAFWLLALSRHRVRLWRAGRNRLEEQHLAGVPASIEEALAFEDREQQLQLRATAAGRLGGAAAYHGHGGEPEDHHARFERFLRLCAPGLQAVIAQHRAPVVVAAVADDAARFRSLIPLGSAVLGVVDGNPDRVDPRALHRAAWPLVDAAHREREGDHARRLVEDQRPGVTVRDPAAVADAAESGRLGELFVERGAQCWTGGRTGTRAGLERRVGGTELVGVAALAALGHGAEVHVVEPGVLGGPLLGRLRQ